MKSYPSISKNPLVNKEVYLFDKLDGSNIRAEWSSKQGFHKFGSRNKIIDESTEMLGESINLIKEYEKEFTNIFNKEEYSQVTAYFEFFGEHSQFGQHIKEPHYVKLIDLNVYKKGFLNPSEFNKIFYHNFVPVVNKLYFGKLTPEIIKDIEFSKLKSNTGYNITYEGVVGKCDRKTISHPPIMFKIKTKKWLTDLKDYCKDDLDLYYKLV